MASRFMGRMLARFLSKPVGRTRPVATTRPGDLRDVLRKGDVLLVEGNTRISSAIKHLTQSTWSHAALYIGDALGPAAEGEHPKVLIEADLNEGVRSLPLSEYEEFHTRICRPVGLTEEETDAVVQFAVRSLGHQYDLKNVFDLARYLIQKPPVPDQLRRRLIAFGSGDPTRAICSTLIAQAFQSVNYPILPEVVGERLNDPSRIQTYNEILHIRHYSLFTPRDFDISPYFRIVKPQLERDFDFHQLHWAQPVAV